MISFGRNNRAPEPEPEHERSVPENARVVDSLDEVGAALHEPGVNIVIYRSLELERIKPDLIEFVHFRNISFSSRGTPSDLKSKFLDDWSKTGNRSTELAQTVADEVERVLSFLFNWP